MRMVTVKILMMQLEFPDNMQGGLTMAKDVMTAEKRLIATINLEPVDRVCCSVIIDQYAGQFAGVTNKEFLTDWDKAMAAVDKLHQTFPIWDSNPVMVHANQISVASTSSFSDMRFPGKELDDNAPFQAVEGEAMTRDDYKIIKEQSVGEYLLLASERAHRVTREQVLAGVDQMVKLGTLEKEASYRRGQSVTWGGLAGFLPFDILSMVRSMDKFYKDMFQLGDELEEILWKINEYWIETGKMVAAGTGVNRVFVSGSRGCGQFINKKHFERFVWPYLKTMVTQYAEHDIVPVLHFDSDWGKNIEYFLDLPKKKFVLELDSSTDIFKAKEILKDHCAIKGDVSAGLLAVASTSEVDDYCKKLITLVGKDGGLLYSCGCILPMNAKHENVKTFFDAVEKYGRY